MKAEAARLRFIQDLQENTSITGKKKIFTETTAYTKPHLRGQSLGRGQGRLTTEQEEGSSEGEAFLAGLSRALPLSQSPRPTDPCWQKSQREKVLRQDKASAAWGWVTLLEPEQHFAQFWFQTFPLGTKTAQWIIKARKCFLPKRKY